MAHLSTAAVFTAMRESFIVLSVKSNAFVAELLDLDIEDVEALVDELGIDDDCWDDDAIEEATELLLEEEEENDLDDA